MSKKKRRYKKRKRNTNTISSSVNCHHILWQKRHWNKGWSKTLRELPYCKVTIPKDTLHRHIHENLVDIPVPEEEHCLTALECIRSWLEGGYIHEDDTIERRIEVLIICFKWNSPKTAEALIKQLDIVKTYKGG